VARSRLLFAFALALALALAAASCGGPRRRGDLTRIPTAAPLIPSTRGPLVARVPEGYVVEAFARGLSSPSGICFDSEGTAWVLEAGGWFGNNPGRMPPRIVALSSIGDLRGAIPLDGAVPPAFGIALHGGAFYVSHRDRRHKGVVSRVAPDGKMTPVVTDLPSEGEHSTNQVALGPDGLLYIAQGTVTNSGVAGPDDFTTFGWPSIHPDAHDVPAQHVVLTGKNFETGDPRLADPFARIVTGGLKPFGEATWRGDAVAGDVHASGSILRCAEDGKGLEVFAWGFRNPFGIGFRSDGGLFVSNQGIDLRGSRPVRRDPDVIVRPSKDRWYGWPDFTADLEPLLDAKDRRPPSKLGQPPQPLLDLVASHLATPDRGDLIAKLPPRSGACGFAWAPVGFGTHGGRVIVALLGPVSPENAPPDDDSQGFRVVWIDEKGEVQDFLRNAKSGPASAAGALGRGLERPIACAFGPDGALYVVDFGVAQRIEGPTGARVVMREGTGIIWRVHARGAPGISPAPVSRAP
jgi:glucose/arabinose dehydrogenase